MKRYHLTVIANEKSWRVEVEADKFHTTTSSGTSSGFYSFYKNNELVACYPISRTVISKIENI